MDIVSKNLRPITGKNKRQLVIDALTALAREIGVGAKLPTMLELSHSLKVAIGTLDDCLTIMESHGIISRKQGSGIYVTPRIERKRVGLVFGGDLFSPGGSPFYSILLNQCMAKAKEENSKVGFSLYIDSLDWTDAVVDGLPKSLHQDLVDALREKKLDGIIKSSRHPLEQEEWLLKQGVPIVALSDWDIYPYRVLGDDDRMIEVAVEALVKEGCRSVGLIGVYHVHSQYMRRALKKYGLTYRREWIYCLDDRVVSMNAIQHEEAGRDAALQLFGNERRDSRNARKVPDGLVIANDIMARGACTQLESRGWTVGKDVKIASHANKGSLTLAEWDSEMILLEMDCREIVDSVFSLLEPLMAGIEPPSRWIVLRPTLKLPRREPSLVSPGLAAR